MGQQVPRHYQGNTSLSSFFGKQSIPSSAAMLPQTDIAAKGCTLYLICRYLRNRCRIQKRKKDRRGFPTLLNPVLHSPVGRGELRKAVEAEHVRSHSRKDSPEGLNTVLRKCQICKQKYIMRPASSRAQAQQRG